MEGWINIKRGWFWQQRYACITQGNFKYFDDAAMTKLKRNFVLKEVQIVQDRMNKIIKFLQGSKEQLQIKTDLHELWYQKLIQSKVSSMDISYIPQFQAQDLIRRNSQSPNVQQLEQQRYNPNAEVSPLQLQNPDTRSNIDQQRNKYQNMQANQQQVLNRTNQLQNQNEIFQQQNNTQEKRQQLGQDQSQQQVRQRIFNPSNQKEPDQNQKIQQKLENNREIQKELEKEQIQKKEQGVFSKIKDFIIGKKEDYYEEKFVSELNNNINQKLIVKQKIEEIILPITTQPNLFNYEQYSNNIKFNFMQSIHLQRIFESQRNILPLRIFLSLFLICIVLFNAIQWQRNQLIYTFCSIVITQFCVLYKYMKSKKIAIKCNVEAYTTQPLIIENLYTLNDLLSKLLQMNRNLMIFEQYKNSELFILDRNQLFQAVYQVHIKDSKHFSINIFTKNYQFLESIIKNFSTNFNSKKGIWKVTNQQILIQDIFFYLQIFQLNRIIPSNNQALLEVVEQKIQFYFSKYLVYKNEVKDNSVNQYLYIIFQIIKDNWQIFYEVFCLFWLLMRLKNQQEQFNWSYFSNWFLLINYGITFTKLTFYIEEIFLNLRNDIKNYEKIHDKSYQNYYKKDIYKISFSQYEIQTQDKINDLEVQVICISFFASILFRDWLNVIQIILIPVLKSTFLKRYKQFFKITVSLPQLIIIPVFAVILYSVTCFFKTLGYFANIIYQVVQNNSTTRRQQLNNSQKKNQVYIKFFQAGTIENYKEQECSICLEYYQQAKDPVFCCKNKHYYHKDCILKWITSGNFTATRKCPLCRVDLLDFLD